MDLAGNTVYFGQGVAAGPVNLDGGAAAAAAAQQLVVPGAGMIPDELSSMLYGIGVPAPDGSMVQTDEYMHMLQASAGYNIMPDVMHHAAWDGVAPADGGAAAPAPAGAGNGVQRTPPPNRGPWTEEDDETLKELVKVHGERKWSVIAKLLPGGRIGKQCRERWTNHLKPGIDKEKSMWTVEDDQALIAWHKVHGNRWSMIARELEGRSENAVKNHWNATRRSLKAKRRLKKKKNVEAAPGMQWTELENYIRSVSHDVAGNPAAVVGDPAAPPAPSDGSALLSSNIGYDEGIGHDFAPVPPGFEYQAAAMELYNLAAGGSSPAATYQLGAMMNTANVAAPSSFMELNTNAYYGATHMMMEQDQQIIDPAPYDNNQLVTHPFIDHLEAWNSTKQVDEFANNNNNNNVAADHMYYYDDAGAGPSGVAAEANQDDDVVQMASREFLIPSEDPAVTLRLAAFM